MLLQALRADFLHHALHRRVDAGDADVPRLEIRLEHAVARRFHRPHHAIGSDRDDPIHGLQRDERCTQLSSLIRQHRLDDVAAEVRVLRPPRRDRRADIGAPDHLIGRRLDVLALEQILALLVAGKVNDAVTVVAHRLRDREQHRIAQPAAEQQHILAVGNLGRRARRTHHDHLLAGLEVRDEPARHTQFQGDHRQQAALLVHPGAGQRDPFHQQRHIAGSPRQRLEILQTIELPGMKMPSRRRRLHDHLDDRRRQAHHLDDARDEIGVQLRHEPRPRRFTSGLRGRIERRQLAREQPRDMRKAVLGRRHRLDDVAGVTRMVVAVITDEFSGGVVGREETIRVRHQLEYPVLFDDLMRLKEFLLRVERERSLRLVLAGDVRRSPSGDEQRARRQRDQP